MTTHPSVLPSYEPKITNHDGDGGWAFVIRDRVTGVEVEAGRGFASLRSCEDAIEVAFRRFLAR